MRFASLATAFALATLACPALAWAEPKTWVEPEGRYSITYDAAAWRESRDVLIEGEYWGIDAAPPGSNDTVRNCKVGQRTLAVAGGQFTQERLNRFIAETYTDAWARGFYQDADVQNVTHTQVDGIEVADLFVIAHTPGGDFRVRFRYFALPTPTGPSLHQIICSASIPFSPELADQMEAIVGSLHFLNARTAP